MRTKLDRWKLTVLPAHRVLRAMQVMPALSGSVPPRILAAILRTWWNGWSTARRYQVRCTLPQHRCMLGCAAHDSIEHYASCSVLADFAQSQLQLQHPSDRESQLAAFLLLDVGVRSIPNSTDYLRRKPG